MSATRKLLILPASGLGQKLRIYPLEHPGTRQTCLFLDQNGQIFELTTVGAQHNTILLNSNYVIGGDDASMVVATPIDTAYFLIATLRKMKNSIVDASLLEDQLGDPPFSQINFLHLLPQLCEVQTQDGTEPMYQYSEAKVLAYLQKKVQHLVDNYDKIPETLRNHAIKPLQDVSQTTTTAIANTTNKNATTVDTIDATVLDLAKQKLAMDLVSTYLDSEVRSLLHATVDFSPLVAHVERCAAIRARAKEQQQAMLNVLNSAKNGQSHDAAGPKQPPAKKPRLAAVKPKNNTSIMDMFKKR